MTDKKNRLRRPEVAAMLREHRRELETALDVHRSLVTDRLAEIDRRVATLEAERRPDLPPGQEAADELDPVDITFLGEEVGAWAVTSELTLASATDGRQRLQHTRAGQWPVISIAGVEVEGNAWIVAELAGVWYAASFEWLRPGQVEKFVTADGMPEHIQHPQFDDWVPVFGDRVGLFVTSPARGGRQTVNERSNIRLVEWGA